MKACATDPLEHYFADWRPLWLLPDLFISAANPEIKNRLIFRCFVVPILCETWLQIAAARPQKMSLFLSEYSARVRAFERLDGELKARAGQIGAGKTSARRPGPPAWLNCTPEEAGERLNRFDAWLAAARSSASHFHQQHYDDSGCANPRELLAAKIGFAESMAPLPDPLLDYLINKGKLANAKGFRTLARNFTKPQASKLGSIHKAWTKAGADKKRLPGLVRDCWLIEIWPLVLAEGWGSESILEIADKSFPDEDDPTRGWKKLPNRLTRLGLKLAEVRRRGGLEPKPIKSPLAPLARLAAEIRGIAQDPKKWIHGRITLLL